MADNKNLNILIVESDEIFSNELKSEFTKYDAKVLQVKELERAIKFIKSIDENLDLIVISADIPHTETISTLAEINTNCSAKIVLISETEDFVRREKYFKYGILDYHLKSNHVDHIATDIIEAVQRTQTNQNETIVVIDDSKVISSVVKFLLNNRNYKVLTAPNAKEGLEIIKNNEVSLLILDMELPDMHGTDVLVELRDMYRINDFPVLILSGSDNPSIVRTALKRGSSDFLRKPFLYEEFLLKIDLWIKSSRWQKTIKKQKQQIENSLKGFKELVDSTIDGIFIFQDDICVDLNYESVKLLGYESKEDLLNKHVFEIFTDVTEAHKKELMDDKIDHFFEDRLINKDNDILLVQIKERNILIDGKILKVIAVMDLTAIKQKEKMLSHQTKMASMGEMIGNIAHQWRQPLTAISVAAGGIKLNYELDMVDEQETLQELENIVSNTQFLSTTIENFQNFLKDDRGTTQFSIRQTIEKTIDIINANLESHEINVIQQYSENIQINAVQNDMIQVLLNIINNAADILKTQKDLEQKRYIIIDVSSIGNNLQIIVQDSAGGVPDNIIGKIFEPYFTTKHQSQGTGLGLYMTHQIIVDNMGGEISVKNCNFEYEDDKYYGAKFTIQVPKG